MRKGIPITLYLDEDTAALLDEEVSKRSAEDKQKGLSGYSVANRSKVASEAIKYALVNWNDGGLSIPEIARLSKPIFIEYGIVEADLFGSFARGEQTEDSDVDILVKIGTPMGLSFFTMVGRLESALGCSVDVQSIDACSSEFLESIDCDRLNIYVA